MKKEKSFLNLMVLLLFVALQSCDDKLINNPGNEDFHESLKEIAIEISQDKESVQFIESLYESENEEFLLGDYVQSMPQRVRAMRVGATEGGDTIKCADEIPVFSSESLNHKIYVDGSYRYQSLNTTPSDSILFNFLNVHQQPEDEIVYRTVVTDGRVYMYNRSNVILHTDDVGSINYSAILDSIRNALASDNSNAKSNQGVKALQSRRLVQAIKSAKASGMQMVSQTDHEIIMEMNLGVFNKSSLPQRSNSSVQKRAVMRFNADMTEMLEQKVYENDQLIQSVTYDYQQDNQDFAKRAPAPIRNLLPDTSVKSSSRYLHLQLKKTGGNLHVSFIVRRIMKNWPKTLISMQMAGTTW